MRRRTALLALCAAGAVPSFARAACLDLPPEGAAQTVLRLDVVDADTPRDPPLIAIDSDGGIAIRLGDAVLRDAMPRDALAAMLESFVLHDRLPEIDGDAIRRAVRERHGFPVADAPTSFLRLTLPDCRHELRVFASAFHAGRAQGIDALERFRSVETRLLEIAVAVQARP